MTRQTPTVVEADSDGAVAPPVPSHADGHSFTNDGEVVVVLKNGTGSSVNVTFQTPRTVDGLAVPERVVAVAAAATVAVGHLSEATYNRPAGGADAGQVYVDFGTVDPLVTATYVR